MKTGQECTYLKYYTITQKKMYVPTPMWPQVDSNILYLYNAQALFIFYLRTFLISKKIRIIIENIFLNDVKL